MDIKPDELYTTEETREFLRISNSTIKRFIKKGIIQANKVGGRYRFLGKEILRMISPAVEEKAINTYQKIIKTVKKNIENW